jgi:hypothetical protein
MPPARSDLKQLLASIGGFILLGAVFVALGPNRVLSLVGSLGANLLVIVALYAAHECIRASAVWYCLVGTPRPSFVELVRIQFLSQAAGALTRAGGMAAEPARAWLLVGREGQGIPAYAAVIAELAVGSAVSAAVNVIVTGVLLLSDTVSGPLLALTHLLFWGSLVCASVVTAVLTSRFSLLSACSRLARRLPGGGRRLWLATHTVEAMEGAIRAALVGRPAALVRVLALESVGQIILLAEIYWTIASMGANISVRSALVVDVMTRAVNVAPLIGLAEAGYAVLFTWMGMPAAVGFALSLVKTLRSLLAAGITLAALAVASRSTWISASARSAERASLDPGT